MSVSSFIRPEQISENTKTGHFYLGLTGFAQINEESGSIDLYFAREGHELPYLENESPIAEHN